MLTTCDLWMRAGDGGRDLHVFSGPVFSYEVRYIVGFYGRDDHLAHSEAYDIS